ncbi:dihydrofolate reductase [Flavobacterium dankookense]|uniref:Dihydrofolate reductase n=1 Tax=Flavobacterium dankookense TaxID=706186 RepID=A0A4R6Q913_9FLAO|nr:dihydrofolate reductase [Flavobacterium dankookense]TDP58635.1 dihydrofolate reductase [Flavobacterium dankookense]
MIILIAAISKNNEIGKNNQLLWHLPDDFKRFKTLTTGHYIIMGRKTFESFPKPLPNRTHIIISRQKNYEVENCIVVSSLEEAIKVCPKNEDIYIIGGGEIYKQSIDFADKLEITVVDHNFEADTFFPEIDENKWKIDFEEFHPKDERHLYDFTFLTYILRK